MSTNYFGLIIVCNLNPVMHFISIFFGILNKYSGVAISSPFALQICSFYDVLLVCHLERAHWFLAAMAALYLTLVSHWVPLKNFGHKRWLFQTWDPLRDLISMMSWQNDKMTKRKTDKKNKRKRTKRQKDKRQRPKREFTFFTPGQFCTLAMFLPPPALSNGEY